MKKLLRILLVALVLLAIALGWVWMQVRAAPERYAPPDPGDGATVALAERIEYGIVEDFHKLRPEAEPWTVRLEEVQLNAWLAARLPEWVAHDGSFEWPADLGAPQVRIGTEGIDLAFELSEGSRARVVVSRLAPSVVDGRLRITVERVGLGRLALPGAPAGRVLEVLERIAPEGVVDDALAEQLLGLDTAAEGGPAFDGSARFDLSDGRRVEIVGVVLTGDAIELTSRTLPPGS